MSNDLNVTVSERAVTEFAAAIKAQGLEGHNVRIRAIQVSPVRYRYELALDGPDGLREDDATIDLGDFAIWAEPATAEHLDGATVYYVEDPQGAGFKINQPRAQKSWDDPLAAKLQELFEKEVNPSIASHGGFIDLVDFKDNIGYVFMGGGCQGCGSAKATLKQGVEARVKQVLPEVKELVDVTDHAAGDNPYM